MRRRPALAVAAAVATLSAAGWLDRAGGGSAAAPDRITLSVVPSITRWGERVAIFGRVADPRAGQKVTVQFNQCGLYPEGFRDAAETTTSGGGEWSVDWLFGRGSGAYRAVWGGAVSVEAKVQGRPSVRLTREGVGKWRAWVTAALPFSRKSLILQRLDRFGRWVTVRPVVLTQQMANHPQFGLPSVSSLTEDFRVRLPKRTALRAILPRLQASPCYLAGYSNVVRT